MEPPIAKEDERPLTDFAYPNLNRGFSLRRTFSKMSRRSYISNLSMINRKNLARFGRSKITFIVSNALFTFCGLAILLFAIFTWFNNYTVAPLIRSTKPSVLYAITVASALMAIAGFVGFLGAFTHKKVLLIFFVILVWPVMAGYIAVGYLAYGEVNSSQWENNLSKEWGLIGGQRRLIQSEFKCCGFLSNLDRPYADAQCKGLVDSTPTTTSIVSHLRRRQLSKPTSENQAEIQGCRNPWFNFAGSYLRLSYIIGFVMIPLCLYIFVIGLLSANHIYD
jgi:hypothetical protein